MMQSYERRHCAFAQRAEHAAIERDGVRIPRAFARLDATPLDGKPVRVVIQRARAIEIRAIAFALPPITRDGRGVAVFDLAGNLFPVPPIVIEIAALDLVRRGCRAPQESVREYHHCLTRISFRAWLNSNVK